MNDPLIAAARFLDSQLEWLRHAVDDQGQAYAAHAFAEIAVCAGRVRGLVNGPAEQRYLGPCGAVLECCGDEICTDDDYCEGDVYGVLGGSVGRCRTCGAEVGQDERRAWLDGEVRGYAFRAAHIGQAYGVNVNTIRSWAARGSLRSYFRTEGGIVAEWVDPAEGETRERLHYVGDVLDLAAADAARRETERAKRERRAANRAADDERMSA